VAYLQTSYDSSKLYAFNRLEGFSLILRPFSNLQRFGFSAKVKFPPCLVHFLQETNSAYLNKLFLKMSPGFDRHLVDVTPLLKHHYPYLSLLRMSRVFCWEDPSSTMFSFVERQEGSLKQLCFYVQPWAQAAFSAPRQLATTECLTHFGGSACNLRVLSREQSQQLKSLAIELPRARVRDYSVSALPDAINSEWINSLQSIGGPSGKCCNLTNLDLTFYKWADWSCGEYAINMLGSLKKLEDVRLAFVMGTSRVPYMVRKTIHLVIQASRHPMERSS
jgi:hypothetical protein